MIDLATALERLNLAGLRRTPQRVAVIEALVGNRSHPTVEDVWQAVRRQMPSISLSTVYATVRELQDLGLVQQIAADPLRMDPDVSPHAHLTCQICGEVVDLPDGGAIDAVHDTARRLGHHVETVNVSVDGLCARCRRRGGRRIAHV